MASSNMRKTLRIGGMTCINCQNRIQRTLRSTPGILNASVSYQKGTADITYDPEKLSLQEITGIIEGLDYTVEKESRYSGLVRTICLLAVILCLYLLLQQFGILNLLAPSQLADTSMGYGMLFLIGLITSVHCVAMCGGINLSQCVPQKPADDAQTGGISTFLPAILYNLGRVLSYTVIGFVLGLLGMLLGSGSEVGLSTLLQGCFKLIAGILMVIMGINMLGLFPWLRAVTLRPPKFLAAKLGTGQAKARRPLVVGLLNGLMPCGPLQSMQIVALASGNPFAGALSMLLFSLGTVPLMLGLGSFVAALGKKFTQAVMTVGAVLVVVLGLSMLSQGGSLSGLIQSEDLFALVVAACVLGVIASIPFSKKRYRITSLAAALCIVVLLPVFRASRSITPDGNLTDSTGTPEAAPAVQVVTSTLSPSRYPNITVQAGIPVKWVIDAPAGSINGCNYKMILQEYGIEYTFQEGENTVEFTPTKAGTYQYSCWMGMIRGSILVTSGDGAPADTEESADVPAPAGYQIPTSELAVAKIIQSTGMQQVSVQLTKDGFQPAVVVVQQDIPVLWIVQNSLSTEGGTQLLAPYYSTALELIQGDNPFSFSPEASFEVSTRDNAFYAYVKVVEDLEQIDTEAIRQEVAGFETIIYPAEIFSSSGASASCCG